VLDGRGVGRRGLQSLAPRHRGPLGTTEGLLAAGELGGQGDPALASYEVAQPAQVARGLGRLGQSVAELHHGLQRLAVIRLAPEEAAVEIKSSRVPAELAAAEAGRLEQPFGLLVAPGLEQPYQPRWIAGRPASADQSQPQPAVAGPEPSQVLEVAHLGGGVSPQPGQPGRPLERCGSLVGAR